MKTWLDKELKHCQRKVVTLKFLDEYLSKHIGETFTLRELRKIAPEGFSAQCASYWLISPEKVFDVDITFKPRRIILDQPIVIKELSDGSKRVLDEYSIFEYTIKKRED